MTRNTRPKPKLSSTRNPFPTTAAREGRETHVKTQRNAEKGPSPVEKDGSLHYKTPIVPNGTSHSTPSIWKLPALAKNDDSYITHETTQAAMTTHERKQTARNIIMLPWERPTGRDWPGRAGQAKCRQSAGPQNQTAGQQRTRLSPRGRSSSHPPHTLEPSR